MNCAHRVEDSVLKCIISPQNELGNNEIEKKISIGLLGFTLEQAGWHLQVDFNCIYKTQGADWGTSSVKELFGKI